MRKLMLYHLKNNKGAALAVVMLLLLIFGLIVTSMIVLFQQDVHETTKQEDHNQAYYIALSGIELGYAALMVHDVPLDPDHQYIDRFIVNHGKAAVRHTQNFADGNAAVTIENVQDAAGKWWVQVTSVGTMTTTGETATTNLRIDMDNTSIVVRDQNPL